MVDWWSVEQLMCKPCIPPPPYLSGTRVYVCVCIIMLHIYISCVVSSRYKRASACVFFAQSMENRLKNLGKRTGQRKAENGAMPLLFELSGLSGLSAAQLCWDVYRCTLCTRPGKLTVWPWKSPIYSGNYSSNPYLAGSMLVYWRVLVSHIYIYIHSVYCI